MGGGESDTHSGEAGMSAGGRGFSGEGVASSRLSRGESGFGRCEESKGMVGESMAISGGGEGEERRDILRPREAAGVEGERTEGGMGEEGRCEEG